MQFPRVAAAAVLAFGLSTAAADAMTIAQPIPLAGSDAPAVTLTAGGCGPGFHRTYWGGCRPFGYGYRGGWHRWHHWGWHRRFWHHW